MAGAVSEVVRAHRDVVARRVPSTTRLVPAARRSCAEDPSPWHRRDAVVPLALVGLGALVAGAGWDRVSRQNTFDDQVGWIVLAISGAVLSGIGMSLWLIVGLRAVRRGQRELWTEVRAVWGLPAVHDPVGRPGPAGPADLVTADRMTRVHDRSCRLVVGKDVRPVSAPDALALGLARCRVCLA